MKKYIPFLLLLVPAIFQSCRQTAPMAELEKEIRDALNQAKGTFAVAFKDLHTGESLMVNADTVFHAASTMKTPVMIEAYKQDAGGLISLQDSVLVKNEFYSIVDSSLYQLSVGDDSEEVLYSMIGKKKTLGELVYDMIIVSSNLATNLVIEILGAPQVTATMRELGAPKIEVLRGVEDIRAYELGLSNTTTAYDLLVIFEKIATGAAVSKSACDEMIKILLDQKFNDIIPARLPVDVKAAHKTGSITGVHHDSGIVFLPDGRTYVLVLMSKNLEDFDAGTEALAGVSRMIYDHVTSKK